MTEKTTAGAEKTATEGFPLENPALARAWEARDRTPPPPEKAEEDLFYFIMNGIF